jgi:hypothetical protein
LVAPVVIMTTPDRGEEMTNALDVFREQQDAARQVHVQLVEQRMNAMTPTERRQVDALMKWKRASR